MPSDSVARVPYNGKQFVVAKIGGPRGQSNVVLLDAIAEEDVPALGAVRSLESYRVRVQPPVVEYAAKPSDECYGTQVGHATATSLDRACEEGVEINLEEMYL